MNLLKRTMWVQKLGIYGGIIAVVGCADGTSPRQEGYPAQRGLIGKTKQEIVACAGSPVGIDMQQGQLLLIYYKEASQLEESFPGSKSSFAMVHHGCRAIIAFDNDRITDVRYMSEPSSYQDEDHCEEIFTPCVGR